MKKKLFLLALFLLAALPYLKVAGCGFVFDDTAYVTENARIRSGLTAQSLRWAATAFHMGNWYPLTLLSHMSDVSLFGLKSGRHHLVNVGFHAGNTILLFLLLRRLTGALRRSWIVSALFAVHPLHVESVAWISERKDLLSAFFFIFSLIAYGWYAARRGAVRYAAVAGLFILGLLSKAMVVTLPFVLLSALHGFDIVRRIRSVSLRDRASILRTSCFICRWLRIQSLHRSA